MGLLSRHETRGAVTPGLSPKDPALADLFSGGINSASGQNVTADTSLAISTVLACVSRVAKTLAMLPLNVMRRLPNKGHEVAENHRLQKQISSRPNRWQTSYNWRILSQVHVMLRGNAYSRIVYYPGRGLNELVPMDPDRIQPFVETPNGSIYFMADNSPMPPAGSKLYYQHFPVNGNTEVLMADEVLHVRGISSNGIVGKNVIRLMRESVGLAMGTQETGARLFSNGAQISKWVKTPNRLSDPVYDRLKKQLSEGGEFAGARNAHRTMILEEGLDIANLSMTMDDAQFLATRQFQVEDIASFLDVPLILINRSGDKNQTFASAEQIISMFITHQMSPWFKNYEQEMSESLLYPSESDEYYIEFDVDGIMRGDSAARAAFYRALFGTASITIDEIRAKEHMSPLPNGEGKKVYIMSNMIPLDMAGQQITQKQALQANA